MSTLKSILNLSFATLILITAMACNPPGTSQLKSAQWLSTLTSTQVDQYKQAYAAKNLSTTPLDFIATNAGTTSRVVTIPSTLNGVTFYKISYSTVDINGKPTIATGQIILPASFADGAVLPAIEPGSIISYQHGTLTERSQSPSLDQGDESLLIAFYFASRGYIVVEADYLGLGGNLGTQNYLNAQTEASAARDMLRASKDFLLERGFPFSHKLFLAGYSQGGHSTVALQRLLETDPRHEFHVTASAPMAGPYNLSQTAGAILANPYPYVSSAEAAFVIDTLNSTYGIVSDLSQAIKAPYAAELPGLFDGTHALDTIAESLPESPADLLQDDLRTALENRDLTSPFVQKLVENDLYNFVPRAPTLLLGGGGDHQVPFPVNALFTFNTMTANHGNVVDLVQLGTLDHPQAIVPAFLYVHEWFDQINSK